MQTFTAAPRLLQCSGGMLRLAVLRLNLVADRLLRYSTTAMARTRLAREIRSGDCRPRERRARRATAKDDFADLTSGSVNRIVLVNHCLQRDRTSCCSQSISYLGPAMSDPPLR